MKEITEKNAISILNSARPYKRSYLRLHKAFDLAIAALNKQIAKKPNEVQEFCKAGTLIGRCASCNGGINSELKYCPDCGQKADWSV